MGFFPSAEGGPHIDPLTTRTIRSPMLNELMQSMLMKAETRAVAEEVKARYLKKLSRHSESGRLAGTARVTSHRSKTHRDRRWEAEFSVGSARADYARPLEERYHLLGEVLAEMGYGGGGGRSGPVGQVPRQLSRPRSTDERQAERRAAPEQPVQKQEAQRQDTDLAARTVRSREAESLLDRADALNRPGRRIGSRARDEDAAALRASLEEFEASQAGGSEASTVARAALRVYEQLRQARGLD